MLKIKKNNDSVYITFSTPRKGEKAYLLSSYFDWEPIEMKRKKDGSFYLKRKFLLPLNMEFGYKIDESWVIEEDLPKVQTPFGSYNSKIEMKG